MPQNLGLKSRCLSEVTNNRGLNITTIFETKPFCFMTNRVFLPKEFFLKLQRNILLKIRIFLNNACTPALKNMEPFPKLYQLSELCFSCLLTSTRLSCPYSWFIFDFFCATSNIVYENRTPIRLQTDKIVYATKTHKVILVESEFRE